MGSLHNKEAEEGLIGCCILGAVDECITAGVDGTWFADLRLYEVYRTIEEMHNRSETIDLSKLVYELRAKNTLDKIGGPAALTGLEDKAPTAGNASYWLHELFGFRTRRQAKAKLENALERISGAKVAEVDDMVSDLQSFITDLSDHVTLDKDETLKDTILSVISNIEERYHNKTETPWGIPTGFINLDNELLGLRNGGLYVLAGRPGQGKTAMGLGIALNMTVSGNPVAVFSLEMNKEEVAMRLMATYANLDMAHVFRGRLDKADFVRIGEASKLQTLPLWVNERTDITINIMRSEARRYVRNYGVRAIVVDYLQLIKGSPESRKQGKYEVVSEISRGLKLMAQELDIPVIALAQLNREFEKGNNQRRQPKLSDLRDSGSIEQDADCCLFLYEPPTDSALEPESSSRRVNCLIAKNRNGASGKDTHFEFRQEYTKFIPLSPVA
jgi:replicative DNA helicase